MPRYKPRRHQPLYARQINYLSVLSEEKLSLALDRCVSAYMNGLSDFWDANAEDFVAWRMNNNGTAEKFPLRSMLRPIDEL